MTAELLFVAVGTLLLGGLVGWLIGGRSAATVRAELAAAQVRADQAELLRKTLDEVEREREDATTTIAALRADHSARAESFEAQLKQAAENRELLQAQFSETAGKILDDAQRQFLDRADARFKQSGEANEEKIKALLNPVETTLKRYEEGLGRIEKEREGSYRELTHAVSQLALGNAGVVKETQRLANVMRSSPKARGRWGEEQTQTILESAGLRENIDFTKQTSVSDGERQLRPDFVVTLPGNRCIVIDVKCPLVAFEQAFDEEDDDLRSLLLGQHADALRSYAADLGRKGYWRQFDQSPEFVIMFVPGEHHLSAAAERAPDLIETAFRNGVVIASTINLLALAKIMAGMWRQEALREQAKEIGEVGRELYKRLGTMSGHVARLGKNLSTAAGAYNDFVGSLESQVYTQARRFETLGVQTDGKPIEGAPIIDPSLRALVKLAPTTDDRDVAG